MRFRDLVVVLGLTAAFLAGCASAPSNDTKPAPVPAASIEPCAPGAVLPKELATAGSVVLFGEIHGTKEMPWFFGEAVCSAVTSGLPANVGLEFPDAEQARLDAFMASPGQPSDVASLLQSDFWTNESEQDGKRSRAMVDLLDRLRGLRAAGLPGRVFAFDLNRGEVEAPRDELMARKVAAQARAHADELTMVLTGDVHSMTVEVSFHGTTIVPMGRHLKEAGLRVYGLGRATPDGTAWTWGPGRPKGGAGPVKAWRLLPSGRTLGIELLPAPTPEGYDGRIAVPTLTASPPATLPEEPS